MAITIARDLLPKALLESLSTTVSTEGGWAAWAAKRQTSEEEEVSLFICEDCYADSKGAATTAASAEDDSDLEADLAKAIEASLKPVWETDHEDDLVYEAMRLSLREWQVQQDNDNNDNTDNDNNDGEGELKMLL